MKDPYLTLDTENVSQAIADCGCALSDNGGVIYLAMCPKHTAAPALAEALKDCADYVEVLRAVTGSKWTPDCVKAARSALKDAGSEE